MLTQYAEDLWFSEHDLFMPGGVHFRGRMTAARLPGGGLWLHSPVPINDALASELAALGPVAHLVAPNRLHHLHLPAAIARYPEARVWGAPGLAAKRPDVRFDEVLGEAAPGAWEGALDQAFIGGCGWINEVVFLHRASRTLIVTDLVFNIHRAANLRTRWVLTMTGAWGRLAQSRLWWVTTRDRAAAAESLERVLAWDFDRLLMAHGDPIDSGARGRLPEALRRMLGGRRLALPAPAAPGV